MNPPVMVPPSIRLAFIIYRVAKQSLTSYLPVVFTKLIEAQNLMIHRPKAECFPNQPRRLNRRSTAARYNGQRSLPSLRYLTNKLSTYLGTCLGIQNVNHRPKMARQWLSI